MKISYNWLKHILRTGKTPDQVAELLTHTGLEVGEVNVFRFIPEKLMLGKIIHSEPHPNADKLRKTLVDVGAEKPLSIVCGAPNALTGNKVVVAPVGTTLCLPGNRYLKIKKSKIRGEVSEGMLCAGDEIGLNDCHDEIITLDSRHAPGTPLEEIWKTPADTVFDIDLTPNRSDAISHFGVSRDLAAVLGRSIEQVIIDPFIPSDNLPLQISVKEPAGCPRYCGVVMKDIVLCPSPPWLQARLKAISLRPINNVVDITNFIMHEMGQPLHAFDYHEIAKKQIAIKVLPEGTPFVTLDDTTHILTGDELMICDTAGPLCMAGIIGGERGKVTEKTKAIFLESACFNPYYIYRATKQHKIATGASYRFERGTDPNMPYVALQKAVNLLQRYAKGNVASMIHDYYPTKIEPKEVPITYAYIKRIIGCELSVEKIHKILETLDIHAKKKTSDGFIALVPPYRRDVLRPIDVVEEILRIYGYNRVKPTKQVAVSVPPCAPLVQRKRTVSNAIKKRLASQGYHEILTNSLISSTYVQTRNKKIVQLANPLSEKLDTLRHTLLFSGLEVVKHNLKRKQSVIRLFEIGKVYKRDKKGFSEPKRLGIWVAGMKETPSWTGKSTKVSFNDLYATVQDLLDYRGVKLCPPIQDQHENYIARLTLQGDDKIYGYLGQVAPAILEKFDIDEPVFFAELRLKPLLKAQILPVYKAPSKYPPVTRDISLAVDKQVTFAQIQQVVKDANIPTLQQLHLVDYYQAPSLGEDKESYTIRLTLQSEEKTLRDKEVNKIIKNLTDDLVATLDATARD